MKQEIAGLLWVGMASWKILKGVWLKLDLVHL